jgi:hypothetical protein
MGAFLEILLVENMALKEETRFTMDLLQGQYFVMQVHQAS